jgi:hypothetical protein
LSLITPAWNIAMNDAYGQALGYARAFAKPVPFLIVADLGHCFDLYAAFDGSWDYRPFPNPQSSRIYVTDLEKHAPLLKTIWTDPLSLDPAKQSAKVTREVAEYLANLAKLLESQGHAQEAVAKCLMRCLFTMFAEDVGLLPKEAFTKALREYWEPNPPSFVMGVETLWRTMNDGGGLMTGEKILKFNGGLFRAPSALARASSQGTTTSPENSLIAGTSSLSCCSTKFGTHASDRPAAFGSSSRSPAVP